MIGFNQNKDTHDFFRGRGYSGALIQNYSDIHSQLYLDGKIIPNNIVLSLSPLRNEAGIKNISIDNIETKNEVYDPIKSLHLKGIKILYADDSLDNQFLIEHFLTKLGAKVSLASDGVEAVKYALETDYDVILMDIQMPKMDGYKAAKILMDLNVKAPIIAVTAFAMTEEKEKTRLIGFDGHLTKPFNFTKLLHEIVIRVSTEHNDFNS
jgi:CheY-like chemotaxis protein